MNEIKIDIDEVPRNSDPSLISFFENHPDYLKSFIRYQKDEDYIIFTRSIPLVQIVENEKVNENEKSKIEFVLHSNDELPSFIKFEKENEKTFIKTEERWYRKGKLYRKDNTPVYLIYYKSGQLKTLGFNIHKVRFKFNHQTNKYDYLPNVVHYYPNGKRKSEYYFFEKSIIKDQDLPSYIHYNRDGLKIKEIYTNQNDLIHRDNGPAVIEYEYPDGEVFVKEEYYKDGKIVKKQVPDKCIIM